LILTAGFGDGHNAAAHNLKAALVASGGPGTLVQEIDIFDLAYSSVSQILKNSYRFGITHLPGAWKRAYDLSDSISYKDDSLGVFRKAMLALKRALEEWQPHAVVHTYPFYSQLLEAIVGRFQTLPFSVTTVITDAVTINQTWLKGRTDTFIVSDDTSREVVIKWGIPDEKIRVMGFPVSPEFERLANHGLPNDRFDEPARILYLPSTPKKHIKETLAMLLALSNEQNLQLTVVLGRHAKRLGALMKAWEKKFRSGQMEIIDWADNIPQLLREHHVVIGKAGGASVQEAIAAHRPLLVNYIVPGQEEGNARQIVAAGCGLHIECPQAMKTALLEIFANDGEQWRAMCAAAKAISKPGAARQIAEFVLSQANSNS
jgi:processive 1,2-diacylglycerol beta-glucosyltransferase